MTELPEDALRRWREHPQAMVRELFGVTPDPWQDEALGAFPHSPRLAMKACAGPGKAQPVDLVIETPTGQRRWGSLQAGNTVFAEDGSATTITAVHARGIRSVYRVTFDDGCSTEVCGEHLWKVRGRTERRHFNLRQSPAWTPERERWARAQGWPITRPDGYAVLSTLEIIARSDCGDGARRQFEIPRQGVLQYAEAALPLHPYVLGAWLGDRGRRTGRGSWRDEEIDKEVKACGYEINRTDGGRAVTVYGISGALRSLGLFELGSHERFVPRLYLQAAPHQRAALLAGLMDTDGSIGDDGSMSFDVTSHALVKGVAWLVRSLGGVATERKSKAAGYRNAETGEFKACRVCYRLTVTLPFNPFYVAHKVERWRNPQVRYLTRYIDRIEPCGEAEVMCIEVEHPSHCYLTNDFIVTHNTAVLAWIGWNFLLTRPHSVGGATSVSGPNLKANLWTELARWRGKAALLLNLFELTQKAIFARESPETWKLEARTWAQDADASQIGNALAGLHGEYVLWLLDETGDYPDAVMPVCESIFAGAPIEAHIVQAGNPTRLSGPLYRAATVARKLWRMIEITADPDDPNRTSRVTVEHARSQIEQYGRDNPWVVVRIFGQFPAASFNALIGPDEITAATTRFYRPEDISRSGRVLGVDVAFEGDDASVMWPRQGLVAFIPTTWRGVGGIDGAGLVSAKWDDWDVDACFVDDTGGFGRTWIDNLKLLNKTAIGVKFSEAAIDGQYDNKRAEMYFLACSWIKQGGQLPPMTTQGMPELTAALTQTTYTRHRDRLLLEPKKIVKKKLGYSPDHADALALSFAHPVTRKAQESRGRPVHTAEWDYAQVLGVGSESARGAGRHHVSDYDPYAGM